MTQTNQAAEMIAEQRQDAEQQLADLDGVLIGANTVLITDTGMGLTVSAGRWAPTSVPQAAQFEPETAARLSADLERQGLRVECVSVRSALRRFIADCERLERVISAAA